MFAEEACHTNEAGKLLCGFGKRVICNFARLEGVKSHTVRADEVAQDSELSTTKSRLVGCNAEIRSVESSEGSKAVLRVLFPRGSRRDYNIIEKRSDKGHTSKDGGDNSVQHGRQV